MSDMVIYSACIRLPGADATAWPELMEMMELWLAHLRGPGEFRGRVLLLTNERTLPLPGVELVPIEATPTDRKALFRSRVTMYDRLGVKPGERWMQMDADTLCLRPIEPLFARAGEATMRAAHSGWTAMRNADPVLGRLGRIWHGRVRGRAQRPGISACLTSCAGEHWHRLMAPWAEAVRRYDAGRRRGPSGDQGLLNLVYLQGKVPVTPLSPAMIHHVRGEHDLFGPEADVARVLHFPIPRRVEAMRRRAVA